MLKMFIAFVTELVSRRQIIVEMAKRDFRQKYLGSYLGMLWAFVHPTVYIAILWFVFSFVFKSQPVNNVPYVLWLATGIIPWFFFSDALSSATVSILENSFLVKKMAFSIGILPLVKLISTLIIHLFFILLIFLMFLANGLPIPIHSVQVLYYLGASIVLLLGLGWFCSSVIIFLRDIGQLVSMALQFLFWGTPIFWSINLLPPGLQPYFKLNPVVYIIEGYRDSLINKVWFWEHWAQTLYFWSVAMFFLLIGAVVFRRLRPHFADVL
ncbi:ABC transporter permease [Geobacter sp. DSM 9736]|uniref:ABC transporter permease n=1 Tax=Geobacter sp. DSM 9736 TaxID=1277350 RepID=UPI000B6126F9|nr:ABC transporter permease [Geobacter sp. DSM 9736]SNB46619.1 lipopolysaccharide transport system permease protein/teichoic acid transport system permease protein [Geobacter sp. DSM 9736]